MNISKTFSENKKEDYIAIPVSKDKCCGCRACEQICPRSAITMNPDTEGFLYPNIDYEKCIKCRRCLYVCPFQECLEELNVPIDVMVAYQKDEVKRMLSRSGGVFVAVSDIVLSQGGVVYGADFRNDFSVFHNRTDNVVGRNRFCGSKYVQSDLNTTFMQVYNDLKEGIDVLYSGTPCQIDALYSFLRNKKFWGEVGTLITMDIVCHGVMSPQLWSDNLSEINLKISGEIISVNFRDKHYGWDSHVESYKSNAETIISSRYTDVFYEHLGLRPCCFSCRYTSPNRVSDLTLADAWGIHRVVPEWDTSKGVSLVLVNTEKGREIFNQAQIFLESRRVELSQMMQSNLEHPTKLPPNRVEFWNEYRDKGYSYVADQCVKSQNKIKWRNQSKARIVKLMRRLHLK